MRKCRQAMVTGNVVAGTADDNTMPPGRTDEDDALMWRLWQDLPFETVSYRGPTSWLGSGFPSMKGQ